MVTAQIKEHTVFVGNIPYGLTEEQIIHVLSQAGQVLNFRLVYDKDTGRPRGYGFAEFSDNDAAASAVRNLNNYETMGRHLRVDWSNDGPSKEERPENGNGSGANGASSAQTNAFPSLPPGENLPPGISCPDAISKTLNAMPPPQLLDMLSQLKSVVDSDPNQVTHMLAEAPQFSYAIFQSLLLLGLVDTNVLSQVVVQAQQAQQQQQQPVPQMTPAPVPQQAMPQVQQPQFQQMPTATPPVPPQQQYPPPQAAAPMQQSNAQQDAMRQILSMTQQQIDAMQPNVRAQLMAIRQQAGIH
ncbi:MAG: hypothetical protein Q9162_007236 [Coniocarpon cinnabarinum]